MSQRYNKPDSNYWYGTTPKDLERVNEFNVTHFAYICSSDGVVTIPVQVLKKEIKADNLDTTIKDGRVRHYHIRFRKRKGSMYWTLKTGDRNIDSFFSKVTSQNLKKH
jgi:hypothetical protein